MAEKIEVIFKKKSGQIFKSKWTKLTVRKSLDELCSYIDIEAVFSDFSKINLHDFFGVYYSFETNGKPLVPQRPVATAFVDNIFLESSSERNIFRFNGRSAARDLIDSRWSDTIPDGTLFEVTKKLGERFGIDVDHLSTTDPTGALEEFSFENESPWQLLQSAAANQGFIITSSQIGGLYVWQVAKVPREEGFSLEEGKNLVTFRIRNSGMKQYHNYQYKADNEETTLIDDLCSNSRILTVNINEPITKQQLNRRVETEKRRRREFSIEATVNSWGLSENEIKKLKPNLRGREIFWELNFLTPVEIPSLGIKRNLITSQVEYKADASSLSCDIRLSLPEEWS